MKKLSMLIFTMAIACCLTWAQKPISEQAKDQIANAKHEAALAEAKCLIQEQENIKREVVAKEQEIRDEIEQLKKRSTAIDKRLKELDDGAEPATSSSWGPLVVPNWSYSWTAPIGGCVVQSFCSCCCCGAINYTAPATTYDVPCATTWTNGSLTIGISSDLATHVGTIGTQ